MLQFSFAHGHPTTIEQKTNKHLKLGGTCKIVSCCPPAGRMDPARISKNHKDFFVVVDPAIINKHGNTLFMFMDPARINQDRNENIRVHGSSKNQQT